MTFIKKLTCLLVYLAFFSPALAEDICNGQRVGGIGQAEHTNVCSPDTARALPGCRSASEESQPTTDKASDGAK